MNSILDWLNQAAFTAFDQPFTWAEVLGFVTGVASVALAAAARVATFPVGIVNAACWLVLFGDSGLYADASLQIVYVVLNIAGWWAWLRLGPNRTELRVERATPRLLGFVALAVAAATVILVPILREAHGSAPFLDALTTSLSLGAMTLMALKRLEHWYVWIVADLIYIPLYVDRGLYLTAIVYVIFLGLCVAGLREWRRTAPPRPRPLGRAAEAAA